MGFDINAFRAQMQFDGARANLFDVAMPFPGGVVGNASAAQTKLTFMARTSQLPGLSNGVVPVYYFGRDIKLTGNRTYPEVTFTILNDEDFLVRNAMEQWLNGMNSAAGNLRNPQFTSATSYGVDAYVTSYGKTGPAIKQYKFIGMFPVDVSPIDVDWSANDTIQEFSVTFAFQYWTSVNNNIQ
jgi:hypothetical protein